MAPNMELSARLTERINEVTERGEGMKVPATAVQLEDSRYDQADYAGEIMAAPMNFTVATTVILENEHVRVWDFQLPIGYRHPFHCHVTSYFWVCTSNGIGAQRSLDGRLTVLKFSVGDVDFLEASAENPMIHDLENVGDSVLRFSTVEILR